MIEDNLTCSNMSEIFFLRISLSNLLHSGFSVSLRSKNSRNMKFNLLHKSKPAPKKTPSLKVTNSFKTVKDLALRTQVEKEACEIFSKFYEAGIVKTSSLPITLYANCLRTLKTRLEESSSPLQLIPKFWEDLTIANARSRKEYQTECTKYNTFKYSPNYDYERILIMAGLMYVVAFSFPHKEMIESLVNAIRHTANPKGMWQEYFEPFEKESKIFNEEEVTSSLAKMLGYIKMPTLKETEVEAIYKFLHWNFQDNEQAIQRINEVYQSLPKSNETTPAHFHIETLNMNGGNINEIYDNNILPSTIKQLTNEN